MKNRWVILIAGLLIVGGFMANWQDMVKILGAEKSPQDRAVISDYFSSMETPRAGFSGGNALSVDHLETRTAKFSVHTGHECASLSSGSVEIPNNSATQVDFSAADGVADAINFSRGLARDFSVGGGGIYVTGTPGESIYLVSIFTALASHDVDGYVISYLTEDGSPSIEALISGNDHSVTGVGWGVWGTFLYNVTSPNTLLGVEVIQTTGAAIDMFIYLQACRVR